MAINFPATPTLNQTYTYNGRTWTYNNVGWQATGSTGLTVYTKTNFTATAGQTSFSATYTVGFVDVYYNGSKLSSSEYTATTGSTVVLGTACSVNDIVETIAWTISSSFNPSLGSASATSLAIGGATIGSNALAVTGTTALSGLLTAAGGVSSTLVTDATSATTGSIITAGGISTQKALWVGTTSRLVGLVTADAGISSTLTTNATSATTGSIITAGGISTQKALWVGTTSNFAGTMTAAAANFSGAQTNTVAGVPYQWTGNGAAVYPSFTGGGAVEYNFSNGNAEVDFWNTANSPTQSFMWRQQTGASSNTALMTLNPAGHLGLGVTPSSWSGGGFVGAMQFGTSGVAVCEGVDTAFFGANFYYNGGYKYINTGSAAAMFTSVGSFGWYIAGSGTAGGAISFTQAMTLDASGNLMVGTTTTGGWSGNAKFAAQTSSGTAGSFYSGGSYSITSRVDSTGIPLIQFFYGAGGVGSITTNGSNTAYNTSSDARLKINISDAAPASALIDAIQVRQFDWKVDNSHQRYGMVAQELLEVAPEAVSVPADPEQMMGVDYSKLVPMLIKEIQSLRTRLAALESK